jgi:hypothetical protein
MRTQVSHFDAPVRSADLITINHTNPFEAVLLGHLTLAAGN